MEVDTHRLGQELIRELRGKRSQRALSRRLGYRSNVIYMWESGRREPEAFHFFRLLSRVGIDPRSGFSNFPIPVAEMDLTTPEGVTQVLGLLKADLRTIDVAQRCEVSRYTASRWLRGESQPRLSDFLRIIAALTLRLLDFVASIVSPDHLPSAAEHWRILQTRRAVAFTHPWSHAVLRLIETSDYAACSHHTPGWIAEQLGIEDSEELRSLAALTDAGLIRFTGTHYQSEPVAVDTSLATAEERTVLKLHWADVARSRLAAGEEGLYSWAVFGVSRADFAELRAMHIRHMQAIRQTIDASKPSELVALANLQLLTLTK